MAVPHSALTTTSSPSLRRTSGSTRGWTTSIRTRSPATAPLPDGVPQRTDVRQSDEYKDAQAEIDREEKAGELGSLDAEHPFPPTHYDNS